MSAPVDDRPLDPRTRRAWLIAGVLGVGGGTLLAGAFGLAGNSGRVGLAAFLVGLAFGASVGALYAVGTAAIDLLRGQPVGNSRLWSGGALFVLGLVFTVMLAGIGG